LLSHLNRLSPLNGEGEAVEAGVNVSVKTAKDTTAEGVKSDSISASEAADKLGGMCPYKASGRPFSHGRFEWHRLIPYLNLAVPVGI
jgi:hypothetical protein